MQHPFATLITGEEISHVPLLLEKRNEEWNLIGHLARANPHWKALESRESVAIFHGPNSYITPTWYDSSDVPTWNYVVVHFRGAARLLDDEGETLRALKALTAKMEPADGWKFEIPEDLAGQGALMRAIIGFELRVHTRVGKFKLSQSRSSTDFSGVMRGLATRKDEGSHGIRYWMGRCFEKE
jgi:transcriptional regulator